MRSTSSSMRWKTNLLVYLPFLVTQEHPAPRTDRHPAQRFSLLWSGVAQFRDGRSRSCLHLFQSDLGLRGPLVRLVLLEVFKEPAVARFMGCGVVSSGLMWVGSQSNAAERGEMIGTLGNGYVFYSRYELEIHLMGEDGKARRAVTRTDLTLCRYHMILSLHSGSARVESSRNPQFHESAATGRGSGHKVGCEGPLTCSGGASSTGRVRCPRAGTWPSPTGRC